MEDICVSKKQVLKNRLAAAKQLVVDIEQDIKRREELAVWTPQEGEVCFIDRSAMCSSTCGTISNLFSKGSYYLMHTLARGELQETEEEVHKHHEFLIARTRIVRRIKELNEGWVPDWKANVYKYYVSLKQKGHLCSRETLFLHSLPNSMYLNSELRAQQLIEELPEELNTILNYNA